MSPRSFTGASREDLIALVRVQAEQIRQMSARIDELERLLRQRQSPPPSAPSSQRPPWDKPKPKPDPKPPGREKGHAGVTRQRPERIDKVIDHPECHCPECGTRLVNVEQREQVVEEIIPARTEVHRHVWRSGDCPRCGKTHDLRPAQARKGAYLGTETMLLAAWLKTHMGLPFRKVAELLRAMAGLAVSPGGLAQGLRSLARDFAAETAAIEAALRKEPSVNADETGLRVAGRGHWLWVFTSPALTLCRAEATRAGRVVADVLGEEFDGVLGCDFYSAYNAIDCPKQRCLAHLMRDLRAALEGRGPGRPPPFLRSAMAWCKWVLLVGQCWENFTGTTAPQYRRRAERWLDALLAMRTSDPDALRLQARMARHRDELTTFLWWEGVEGTNNRAERAIRPAVITRKISGGHRSWPGARAVADVTSVVRTCALQARDFVETGLEIIRRRHLGLPHPTLA